MLPLRAEVTSFLTDELGIDPRPADTPLGTLRLQAASRVSQLEVR